MDVVYAARRAPIWRDQTSGAFSDETRLAQTKVFYRALARGRIERKVLEQFDATYFVSRQRWLMDADGVDYVGEVGLFLEKEWALFRITP